MTKTNDRMKFQDGLFILFDDYILQDPVRNVIYNRKNPKWITKIIIHNSIKEQLLKYLLTNYEDFNLDNLMNPYGIFEKRIKNVKKIF